MGSQLVREYDVEVADGLVLHAREHGPHEAPAVLVLHGIMGHAREWYGLVDALAPRFRVVAIDQRGHGRSGWASTYTAAAMTADAAAVVEHLDLGEAHVVGHSMGGMVALLLAARRPELVRTLALVDVGPEVLEGPMADELPGHLQALARQRLSSVDEGVALWMAGDPFAREDLMRNYVHHCLVPDGHGALRWRFDGEGLVQFARGGVSASELWAAVDRVRAPSLVIRGRHSPVFEPAAARELAERLPACRVVEVADGAHDLGVQQPAAVAAAVLEHLAVVGREAA